MSDKINDAAKAAREAARNKGKFGEQHKSDPGQLPDLNSKPKPSDPPMMGEQYNRVAGPKASDLPMMGEQFVQPVNPQPNTKPKRNPADLPIVPQFIEPGNDVEAMRKRMNGGDKK